MSETTEPDGKPEPGTGPSGVPDTPAPPAPESTPPETDEPTPAREADERDKEDRRIAALRARLGAAERAQDAQRAELEHWRRVAAAQPQQEETPEQRMARFEAEADARAEARLLQRRFHEEGNAAFPDWKQRCDDLMEMGADPQIAKLLVDTPGGVRIAAALAEDPAALERIANIQSPHGRAVALGKYAATIEDAPPARGNWHSHASLAAGAAPTPQVTRAPAPIRPVTGRANPTFNEYTAPPEQLVDVYLKRDLERARGGSRR